MTSAKAIGDHFERQAAQWLTANQLAIIATNYHVARVGEIDIIAYDKRSDTVICVEVKARKSGAFGSALEMVGQAKQGKLIRTMGYFLLDEAFDAYKNSNIRFDVVAFDDGQISWLKAAFLADSF